MRGIKTIILMLLIPSIIQLAGCFSAGPPLDDYIPFDQNAILGGVLIDVIYPMRPDQFNPQPKDTLSITKIQFNWNTEYYIDSEDTTRRRSLDAHLFFVGIFTNRIESAKNEIINKNDMIWAWHSGLNTGRNGSITYSDGRNAQEGNLKEDSLELLIPNQKYYWAVWGWNSEGRLMCSSMEMFFYTKD